MSKPVAVILGCSTGTGAACVRTFANEGYRVIGFHRGKHPQEATRLSEECKATFITADAGSSYEAVETAIDKMLFKNDERVDVLVHALSGASIGTTIGQDVKGIERTFNLMAHSFLWWTQGLLKRELLPPYGALFALTNPLPNFYLNGSGVVGPAKAALETYVKHLAVELGPQHISVNAVRFSTIMTPALEKVLGDVGVPRMLVLHNRIMPGGYMQETGDVAAFIESLVCNERRPTGAILDYTTGATLTLLDYAFRG